MNAAIFASSFHPYMGGVEELVRQLAKRQSESGSKPLVLTNRWPKVLPARETYEGIPVRRHIFRVPESSLRRRMGTLLLGSLTLNSVCKDLHRASAEVVHVQCVSCNSYYAVRAARRLRLPLVVTLQGELSMDASGIFQKSPHARALMREALLAADVVTGCSADTLAEGERFLGTPFGSRARVIYNGISLKDFNAATPHPHCRPYVLALGRHVPQKGFDLLLRAFSVSLARQDHGFDLLLGGDGTETPALSKLASELGLTDRVHFLGRIARREAVSLFSGCSLFVLPSRHEPMGIVNLEAMAAGKAILATRVGGVPELVLDGVTGVLVPPEDVEALASGLSHLLGNPEVRLVLGTAGRKRAEQFDWSAISAQYAETYAFAEASHATKSGSK